MTMGVSKIRQGLDAGEFSSVEITSDLLARIEKHNPKLNCFISVTEELALRQAQAADAALAGGNAGLLTGVPLAHKDLPYVDDNTFYARFTQLF